MSDEDGLPSFDEDSFERWMTDGAEAEEVSSAGRAAAAAIGAALKEVEAEVPELEHFLQAAGDFSDVEVLTCSTRDRLDRDALHREQRTGQYRKRPGQMPPGRSGRRPRLGLTEADFASGSEAGWEDTTGPVECTGDTDDEEWEEGEPLTAHAQRMNLLHQSWEDRIQSDTSILLGASALQDAQRHSDKVWWAKRMQTRLDNLPGELHTCCWEKGEGGEAIVQLWPRTHHSQCVLGKG